MCNSWLRTTSALLLEYKSRNAKEKDWAIFHFNQNNKRPNIIFYDLFQTYKENRASSTTYIKLWNWRSHICRFLVFKKTHFFLPLQYAFQWSRYTAYLLWWRWHSSKYFFIKRKLSRNLWGSMFILTNSLNFFAGTSKTSFNLDFKTGGKFVCFDLLVVGASSSLLYAKLTTKNCQKNFPNWNWFYMFQQKNSKKSLR